MLMFYDNIIASMSELRNRHYQEFAVYGSALMMMSHFMAPAFPEQAKATPTTNFDRDLYSQQITTNFFGHKNGLYKAVEIVDPSSKSGAGFADIELPREEAATVALGLGTENRADDAVTVDFTKDKIVVTDININAKPMEFKRNQVLNDMIKIDTLGKHTVRIFPTVDEKTDQTFDYVIFSDLD